MVEASIGHTLFDPNHAPARPELLVAAVLHLMSQYIANGSDATPCVKLASVIERHLKALAGRSDLAPVLQATCEQLSEQWAELVEDALPTPSQKPHFLERFFASRRTPQ